MSELPSAADRFGPYDERNMIRYTIFRYQSELLTEIEWNVESLFVTRFKARNSPFADLREQTRRNRFRVPDDPRIDELLALGWPAFQDRVTDRIMAECPEKLKLNRCPACHKIVLTPQARWCMWCHHDWH